VQIVVTGGAGFIGAHVSRALARRGLSVVVLDDLSTGTAENLAGLPRTRLVLGDVRDRAALDAVLVGARGVVHLAARPNVTMSVTDPLASHAVNVTGTLEVLESARRHGVGHVVLASSSAVYGDRPSLPKTEADAADTLSPYAATKLAVEAYGRAYGRCFGMSCLAFRFFNVYGPLQPADHAYAAVVPAFVAAALRGGPVEVHGDGEQTRDFVFVGDVGRPDLLTSIGWTADDLARRLYRSLHEQLLTLPDATRVFPAHGAGSACGRAMTDAVSSTIGEQRALNYALRPMSEDAFVEVVTQGQPVAPLYFSFTADTNRRVHELLDDADRPAQLTADDVERMHRAGSVIIDGRTPESFASGHLRGAVNVGLDGRFAEYAGDVVRPGQAIIVVTDDGRATEAKVRLARIGFDSVLGAVTDIEGLLADRPDLAARAPRLAAPALAAWRDEEPGLQIVDVRNPGEQEAGVVPGAVRLPLARLLDRHRELDPDAPTVVYCASGYRSSIAASLLRALGFSRVADLQGGFGGWATAGLPVSA